MANRINAKKIMDGTVVALSTAEDSLPISLNEYQTDGVISIQYIITGDGTCKIEWLQSSDGDINNPSAATNFVLPSGGYELANTLTDASGTGTDGKDMLTLSTIPSTFLKLRVTETGGANSVTVTLIITTN